MDIGIFGCSFTEDLHPWNWPRYLSERHKDHTFWDYSAASSSLLWSIQQMNEFKQRKPNSKIIFQITTPFRITNSLSNNIETKITNNYYKCNREYESVTPGKGPHKLTQKMNKIFDDMVKNFPHEQRELEYQICVDYVKRYSDFCYAHRGSYLLKNQGVRVVQRWLGETKFAEYCQDYERSNFHFNETGTKWLAEFVEEEFKWN